MYLDKNEVDFLDLIGFDNSQYPDNFNLSFIDNKKYSGYCCTIVLAATGYPEKPIKDFYIDLSDIHESENLKVFHAGTVMENNRIKSIGGRILTINTFGSDRQKCIDLAYDNIKKIRTYTDIDFKDEDNGLTFFREDIGR